MDKYVQQHTKFKGGDNFKRGEEWYSPLLQGSYKTLILGYSSYLSTIA